MAKFDSKSFNPNVFKYAVDHIENLRKNEIVKSKAIIPDADLKDAFTGKAGTGYATIVMTGLLEGDAVNYDGETNITATTTKTFEQGAVVVGRAKGFVERQFSKDITAGVDFMQNVASQISDYLYNIDQDTLLAELQGVFSMNSDAKSLEFVTKHTTDLTANAQDADKLIGATTLNNATKKACGANKSKFSLVFMHSEVATNLENLNLLEYLKYTDPQGVQRDLSVGAWNGKIVVVDDYLPTTQTVSTQGVYTIQVTTQGVATDKFTICGQEFEWVANGTTETASTIAIPSSSTAAKQASAIKDKLAAVTSGPIADFTWTVSSDTITATQKTTAVGARCTCVVDGDATFAVTFANGTAAVEVTNYTTYVLGDGSIKFADISTDVPYEMHRDPSSHGGEDTLYVRSRKCFAPFGLSYTKRVQATQSPTNSELKNGANWALVSSGEFDASERAYINHKSIPICRIISRG